MAFCSEFPPGSEMISQIQPYLSLLGYGIFFKNDLADFEIIFPVFLWVHFLHRKTYLLKYLTSVCQSVSLSIRQSASPPVVWICNPLVTRPQVLGLFLSILNFESPQWVNFIILFHDDFNQFMFLVLYRYFNYKVFSLCIEFLRFVLHS